MILQPECTTTKVKVAEAPPESWDALVRQFPEHTVFHSTPWLEAVSAAHGVRPVLACARVGDRCVAVWPYLELRKGPLRVLGSPLPGWATAYMGPLVAADADVDDILTAFLGHRLFRGYVYFACKVIDRARPIDLAPLGFSVVRLYDTYWLDLNRSEEKLWDNLTGRCRTAVRKALKEGLQVREEETGDFLEDYWDMTVETFARSGVEPTHSRELLVEMWRRLKPAGMVHALSAFHEGVRVATAVMFSDDHAMYYWGSAAHLQYRHLSPSNLLLWEAIRLARQRALRGLDFVSATGSFGEFKKSFGPVALHTATHWERSPSRIMAALKDRYEQFLRKRRRISS